ncbi:hypothetical protein I6N95_18505 [Vagococcus sp. BWB3-3]|uniref:Uncharacterized protein n=1 Tax=Vagococcus allomyrinae TaxID=2794353 RepID=A0A940P8H4_9ENTE|nr:hypothetical protein [Vagococcus allomyrinae]MBP1043010.1 hypothetical protein [Vagococcus allomyrinae]
MKLEDQASLAQVKQGNLGKVTFLRYSLTLPQEYQEQQDALLSEVIDWIKGAGVTNLHSASASYAKGKKVLVITLSFAENVLANLLLNLESVKTGFVKKSEIAGTKGLYSFNSESETAFTSDCIQPPAYQVVPLNGANREWLNVINTSLATGEVEVLS